MTRRYDPGLTDPLDSSFSFGGMSYSGVPGFNTGVRSETLEANFLGMVQGAYKRNAIVFACLRARTSVFSEARFQFRRIRNGRPTDLFGTADLGLLENPWPNGTTGDLLTRMLQDADLAGNSYWTVRDGNLRRMRPDWVSIVMGSHQDPAVGPDDLDAELLGYTYWPGGPFTKQSEPIYLTASEVAHFAPTPDPIAHYRGMSWLTPVIREIQADTAATVHKLAFFENGANLQAIVSFKEMQQDVFEAFVRKMDAAHKGAQNAFKTLYLGGGADVTVVGTHLRDLDFSATQGAGESRIAAAAGVPAAIVGFSEGLKGSSLNAGNLGQLRRQFAEGTLSTLWRNAAASLATLIAVPADAELWYDTRDIPFLREDRKDRSDIAQQQAATLSSLINAGYTPDSAVAALESEDWTLLVHTGLFSVQLQPPGSGAMPGSPESMASAAARDRRVHGLIGRNFNPDEPRGPHSGEWIGTGGAVSAVKDALKLAGKIDLAPDEHLIGSGKVDGDSGQIRMALTDLHGFPSLRLGVGSTAFGDDPPWIGGPGADFSGATARLDSMGMRALADLSPAIDQAERLAQSRSDTYDEIERLRAQGGNEDRIASLLAGILGPDGKSSYQVLAQGVIPGADWGDLHYEVFVDDPTFGAVTVLGVRPRDADADWVLNGSDWSGEFGRSEMRKFLRLLAQMAQR